MEQEMVDIEGDIIQATNMAIFVAYGEEEEWLPISQIEFDETAIMTGEVTTIKLPRWLAEEKGFV
jgi:hypothetical protein